MTHSIRIKILFSWIALAAASAAVLDRIAVTVGNDAITGSEVMEEIRITSFLNNEPLDFSAAARRAAAERLVDQYLIRHELAGGSYHAPDAPQARQALADFVKARFQSQAEFEQKMKEYGVSEDDLDKLKKEIQDLLKSYEDKIDEAVKVLLVIHPRDISEKAQYAIDQFVLRGGKLIAFLDAQSLVDSRSQNPMMGGMPGGGSSLDKLLKAWGLQFDTAKVVADRTFRMELGEAGDTSKQRPAWLALTPEGINSNDIATAELDNVWMFSAGAFTGTPAPGLKETVLLHSSPDSQLVEGMLANFSGESVLRDFKPSGVDYALAVRLTGKFKTAFPEGKPEDKKEDAAKTSETNAPQKKIEASLKESAQDNTVVLVGDADMIYDGYTLRRINSPFGTLAVPMNGNLNFAQNLLEQLSGDEHLIAVRSRTALNRPFTRVNRMEADAEAEYLAKIKELEENRDQAVTRLNELQNHKSQNQRFILSPEQQAEIENLRKKEAEISRELRQVKKDLRRNVVALQRRLEWLNVAAVPAAVCLAGVGLAMYKRKRTSAK